MLSEKTLKKASSFDAETMIPPDIGRAVLPALANFPRQNVLHAPYGLIWYMLNWPIGILSANSPRLYMFYMGLFNIPFIYLAFQFSLWLGIIYAGVSMFHLFKATWNVSILWLCLLGLIHPLLLIIPILAKFPVGNPAPKVWSHVFHAMTYKMSPFYYFTMGIVWLAVAFRL